MKVHHDASRDHVEIELKLLFDPADEDALCKHSLLEKYAIEKPHLQELESIYFDTPDFHLRRQKASLRVRKTGSGWRQTLKGGGKVEAGLHQHNEWESDVNGPALDLAVLREMAGPASEWGKLLDAPALTERLAPVFATRVTRAVWNLRLPEGDDIEFAVDRGTIECGTVSEPISEIELELKSGEPSRLFRYALQLLDTVPLRIGNLNKAVRGYALRVPQELPIVKAAALALSGDMSIEHAFQIIAANCNAQIQGNEIGVLHGNDPESVHQMRVGVRRLRSALRLFGGVIQVPAQIREELGWLAAELGAVRDWEVLADFTLTSIVTASDEASGIDRLKSTAAAVAHDKREQAAVALRSPRYTRLMLTLSHWLLGAGWRDGIDASKHKELDAPVQAFAGNMLKHDHRRLRKRGRKLRGADAAKRHRMRIAAKKLRYATEFFQSLYPPRRVKRYVKSLARMQDELGRLNDAAVAQGLLPELKELHPELASDIEFARGYLACVSDSEARSLYVRWKRFKLIKAPYQA
ncbi:CHAD domain-containing protein [Noviherbaspirillum cavernae]|uniref:CHAD domain-containing protein n=1 Tax=Noviherbaspirillum cavernae TaxID=2320862 RepID=A0A418X0L4_9BURK|nr:CYTH and CHAD domain-containing protein [Noviherbaspirillum cavernae]RJG05981.1 CHAD domain-containing protein [Noviherbaspirillum cavernae]